MINLHKTEGQGMTDYTKLVEALRHCATRSNGCVTCAGCPMSSENGDVIECINALHKDSADAIEALQAEVQFYDALAEERKSAAESKERLLGLYRAEQAKRFYSATDNNGRVIQNPCACLNIPVFSDCSENPNG